MGKGLGLARLLMMVLAVVALLAPGPVGVAASAGKPFISAVLAPASLPADGATTSALYLELVGPSGQPVVRGGALIVALRSLQPQIVTVPSSAVIPAGRSMAVVPVTTTRAAGSATITVSAIGLAVSAATVTTTALSASGQGGAITLSLSPAALLYGSAGPAQATVELLDSAGEPELAEAPVTLNLLSSAPSVLRSPATVTVLAGQYSATVNLTVGSIGAVTLTAMGDGYNPGIAHTLVERRGLAPAELQATLEPPTPLPGTTPRLVLEATDPRGVPVPFPCGTVYLSSNAPALLDVPASITPHCAPDATAVVVNTRVAVAAGKVSLTVAAAGLDPVTVQAPVATAKTEHLAGTVAPLGLDYGASQVGWLVIAAESPSGAPAVAAQAVPVHLVGPAGVVPTAATIPAGATSVAVPLTGIVAGQTAEIVVSAPGFTSTRVAVSTAAPTLTGAPAGGGGPAITVFGRRVPLKWILLVQLAAVLSVGAGLFFSGGRRGRRAA